VGAGRRAGVKGADVGSAVVCNGDEMIGSEV
jgi:hypothetical protein